MASQDVVVPQMGEGLQEVRIVEFVKKPGDAVKRDDVLYSMETDKAVMEIESPYEGVLVEWLAAEGDVLPIGAPIARMTLEEGGTDASAAVAPAAAAAPAAQAVAAGESAIPPRTRAYGREKGLDDDAMRNIAAAGSRLMPADIDAWLERGGAASSDGWHDVALSPQHRAFVYRLKRSQQLVVPAVIKRQILWGPVKEAASALRNLGGGRTPTSFQVFSYAFVQAVKAHPRFRSILVSDTTLREFDHVNIGIAVGGEGGKLTMATVSGADTLNFTDFTSRFQAGVDRARAGEDQADENVQTHLTYMGAYDVVDAIPVLVSPAAAIMFIGSAFESGGRSMVNLVLTFDHRIAQGIEAAEFMVSVAENAANVAALVGVPK